VLLRQQLELLLLLRLPLPPLLPLVAKQFPELLQG
jgi:hypothetical protein